MLKQLLILSAVSLALVISCGGQNGQSVISSSQQPSLKFKAPDQWISEQPSSSMRVAQYRLPRAEGDAEDGSLVLYYFSGQGGSVQANLDRWIGQMDQPDGSSSRDKAKTEQTTVNGLQVTVLDVTGTYKAEVAPMSSERVNKPNFRMIAAVVETSTGPYFFKLVGPAKTVTRWNEGFHQAIKSVEFK